MSKHRTKGRLVIRVNQKRPKQKSRKSGRGRTARSGMSSVVLSRINPFLSAVNGMRAPDNFGYPSATAVLKASQELSPGAAGYFAIGYMPLVSAFSYSAVAPPAGGGVTWAGGSVYQLPQLSSITNLATVYRTVGWGLRITTDLSLTAASGHLWVAHIPLNITSTPPYFDWPVSEAGMAQLPLSEKFSLVELAERPLIVAGRAFDDGVYRFRAATNELSVTPALESTFGWCAIVIYISGAPTATNAVNVEYVQHIEYIQDGASLYGFVDALPGSYQPAIMAQAAAVAAAAPVGLIETTVSTVEMASQAAVGIMGYGARLANAIAPMARIAGKYMEARGYNRGPASSPFAQIEYKQDY